MYPSPPNSESAISFQHIYCVSIASPITLVIDEKSKWDFWSQCHSDYFYQKSQDTKHFIYFCLPLI